MIGVVICIFAFLGCVFFAGSALRDREWLEAANFAGLAVVLLAISALGLYLVTAHQEGSHDA